MSDDMAPPSDLPHYHVRHKDFDTCRRCHRPSSDPIHLQPGDLAARTAAIEATSERARQAGASVR